MDVRGFCTQSRVLIVAGKGGVGKTTMVAALARVAADAGLSVLIVELEGRTGIAGAFGPAQALGYDEVVLDDANDGSPVTRGTVRARMVTPDDALVEYLVDHGFRRISKRLAASGIVDVVSSAIPGIRDVLVLGKVKQLERSGVADLVLVDAPATGHALTFLSSAGGLLDAARSGPVRTQAADVAELLGDPSRCQVVLVTLPEEMPVNEVVEAAYQLEDRIGVALGPVVVNGCLADTPGLDVPAAEAVVQAGTTLSRRLVEGLEATRSFHLHRVALQHDQLDRLTRELPLPQLRTPYLFADRIGPDELAVLARALAGGITELPGPASVSP
ncbi:MAG: ArsA family ATPase [Acidimicrobiales bacterium]